MRREKEAVERKLEEERKSVESRAGALEQLRKVIVDYDSIASEVIKRINLPNTVIGKLERPNITVRVSRPQISADDETTLGRLALLISSGWWDERHTVKQVHEEFSNRGWKDGRKEIEEAMEWLCSSGFLYRKRSTGNMMWYQLTPEAKGRIRVEQ